ncbi:peptidoglycan-binding protein [Roseospira visakhapatnamensis]|uniref:Peptidoglycan hydrolase-like protein with peptidoglycan-binding domain n=1 Tax=Roseospira visakhapatnamensis TaxID=390880 RepID=A0A7W6RH21_9PROT|nr:peptidoglycan-binding protein [Roseospira visakhapatnamensis]MBB4267856.1 peptidoglycan hydrolase-like protein with peptidoglycan-binding domain [Roseospira visakhapatnamensis]
MAEIIASLLNKPDARALVDLVQHWLPTVETDPQLGPVYDRFLTLTELRPGTQDENVVRRGLRWNLGPRLVPEEMARTPGSSPTYGYVSIRKKNTIHLNAALIRGFQTVAHDPAARKYIQGLILHELIHWVEVNDPDPGSRAIPLHRRSEDHGRKMERFFHGDPTDETHTPINPPVPQALNDAFLEAEALPLRKGPKVAKGGPDGVPRPGALLDSEAGASDRAILAFELAKDEPVLDITPALADADPDGNRFDTPDFAHLVVPDEGPMPFDARPFKVDHNTLDLFCRINDIEPDSANAVLFGLRGCDLHPPAGGSHQPMAATGMVSEAKYDHTARRCVLGVWDRSQKTVALFQGSTVPNLHEMRKQVGKCTDNGVSSRDANMLPTGCYRYVCGAHNEVWNAFRLFQTVVVLRSCENSRYALGDLWDRCAPGDNIHPTYHSGTVKFSSAGCQTVSGTFAENRHRGDWATFRQVAGLSKTNKASDVGRRFSYLLVTAREMRLMRLLIDRSGGSIADAALPAMVAHFGRLRFGASGDRVRALQRVLGVGIDGAFGPQTAMALIEAQKHNGLRVDGICTRETAEALGVPWAPGEAADATAQTGPANPVARAAAARDETLGLDLPLRRGDRNNPSVMRAQQLLNRMGAMIADDGDYGAATSRAVAEARNELGIAGSGDEINRLLAGALFDQPALHQRLSTEGGTFIGRQESGGRTYYERFTAHPHYPGVSSGITIGFGYDLQFIEEHELSNDWGAHLSPNDLQRLTAHCGKPGSKAAARALADIRIAFADSLSVYLNRTLPDKIAQTDATYPQTPTLPALCQTALVSLVLNRGTSLEVSDSRREMIDIWDGLSAGDLDGIPAHFEAMTKHWPNSEHLRQRRLLEAALFRRGLAGETGY